MNTPEDREFAVLTAIRAIPEGFVRTYGDVSPGAPRFTGAVLFECDDPELPWWRVVRTDGSLAKGDRQPGQILVRVLDLGAAAQKSGAGPSTICLCQTVVPGSEATNA
jgi:alkylated DNA nucleotide flippase Atl1